MDNDVLAAALDSLTTIAEALEPDGATKAGRRNNAADQALLDAALAASHEICELLVSLGAVGEDDEDAEPDDMPDEDEAAEMSVESAAKTLPPAELDEPGAIKMLANGGIGGYAVRFGSDAEPDLSPFADYFTKSTEFWIDAWATRPMLYHHAQDAATKDAPVVGRWTSARMDDVGIWLEGQIDQAHRYAGAVKELVKRGVLKLSSDSAPHLVVREQRPNGTHEVKRWPLLAASLTVSPAEPRLMPVSALKAAFDAAGLLPPAELIDDSPEAHDLEAVETAQASAVKAAADLERERLILELDLLSLEAA